MELCHRLNLCRLVIKFSASGLPGQKNHTPKQTNNKKTRTNLEDLGSLLVHKKRGCELLWNSGM